MSYLFCRPNFLSGCGPSGFSKSNIAMDFCLYTIWYKLLGKNKTATYIVAAILSLLLSIAKLLNYTQHKIYPVSNG